MAKECLNSKLEEAWKNATKKKEIDNTKVKQSSWTEKENKEEETETRDYKK